MQPDSYKENVAVSRWEAMTHPWSAQLSVFCSFFKTVSQRLQVGGNGCWQKMDLLANFFFFEN